MTMAGRAGSLALALALAVGAAAGIPPAAWAEDEPTGRSAVYLGAAPSPALATGVAELLARLEPPVALTAPPFHVDEVAAPGGMTVIGGGGAQRCEAEPVDAAAFGALGAALYDAIFAMADTSELLRSIDASWACLSEPVPSDELARPMFLRGVVAADEGDEAAARWAFAAALAVEPALAWDPQFSPTARTLFEAVARAIELGTPGTVRIELASSPEFALDGRALSGRSASMQVPPGRHVLHVREAADGPWVAIPMEVIAGATTTVIEPALLADPDADPDGFTGGAAALFSALQRFDVMPAPDHLVWVGERPRVWRFERDSGGLVAVPASATALAALLPETPVPDDSDQPRARALHPAVPVLIGVGAGVALAGALTAGIGRRDLTAFNADVAASPPRQSFPAVDDPDRESDPDYLTWQSKVATVDAGVGLLVGGIVVGVAAVPVWWFTSRRAVTVSAGPLWREQPDGTVAVDGAQLTLRLQPGRAR